MGDLPFQDWFEEKPILGPPPPWQGIIGTLRFGAITIRQIFQPIFSRTPPFHAMPRAQLLLRSPVFSQCLPMFKQYSIHDYSMISIQEHGRLQLVDSQFFMEHSPPETTLSVIIYVLAQAN